MGNERGVLSRRARIALGVLGVAAVGVLAATVVGGGGTVEATIPAGTRLVAALDRTLSTERVEAGEPVVLRTTQPLELGEEGTIPAGVTVRGEVTHAKGGGRIAGAPEITIRFHRIEVGGATHEITAEPFRVRGQDDLKQSVAMIGGGTVVGGVVGAIAGNTVAGAAAGAVLGTGAAVVTKGDQIVLPAGQKLRVRLTEPVTVRFKPEPEPEEPRRN
ncbi:MAG: hypothetical protein ACRENB_10125 [Gemmatimonadales bacterium]